MWRCALAHTIERRADGSDGRGPETRGAAHTVAEMRTGATIRRRVIARGAVQGVGFRFSAARAAGTRGVAGWIRNRADGSVEAVLEGAPAAVESMVEWCRRGPPYADVASLEVHEEDPQGLEGFSAS